ncbi:hypothetical protein [Thermoflavimicrobium daqui]|jgi:hypothetical protein|uniref:Uncharacterized protein n=1 Tax=Thermoflavimicrobium daqui TaxID=2137476 RepID=A0A364K839_9BACL|nr:hypothetical protein [Thermoflavimicrobium daqui]RAL26360.1 hypothetical protein DL897_05040 [Thermoflavimicrobium daqui]
MQLALWFKWMIVILDVLFIGTLFVVGFYRTHQLPTEIQEIDEFEEITSTNQREWPCQND